MRFTENETKIEFDVRVKYDLIYGIRETSKENASYDVLVDVCYRTSPFGFNYASQPIILKPSDSIDMAINNFCINANFDGYIIAIFEHPEILDLKIQKLACIDLYENNNQLELDDWGYGTVHNSLFIVKKEIIKFGPEFLEELKQHEAVKEAYAEIQSAIEKEKAEAKKIARDKNENLYNQWKWLQKKFEEGVFDEFIEKGKESTNV